MQAGCKPFCEHSFNTFAGTIPIHDKSWGRIFRAGLCQHASKPCNIRHVLLRYLLCTIIPIGVHNICGYEISV